MKKKLFTTAFFICFAAMAALAIVADLTGKWSGQLDFNGQTLPLTYNFKVDGEKLTGTGESPYGVNNIENGKVTGNEFSFTTTVQDMEILQSGKFYGDSVGLDVEVNGAKYHATLKRAQ